MKTFNSWNEILDPILASKEMQEIKSELKKKREAGPVWPKGEDTFRAFKECNFEKFHICIMGQE
jgi:uracil DNA glycosylase